jgi:hypothetical protein
VWTKSAMRPLECSREYLRSAARVRPRERHCEGIYNTSNDRPTMELKLSALAKGKTVPVQDMKAIRRRLVRFTSEPLYRREKNFHSCMEQP